VLDQWAAKLERIKSGGHVALHAGLHDDAAVTSDVDDVRRVDPSLPVIPA